MGYKRICAFVLRACKKNDFIKTISTVQLICSCIICGRAPLSGRTTPAPEADASDGVSLLLYLLDRCLWNNVIIFVITLQCLVHQWLVLACYFNLAMKLVQNLNQLVQ